MRLIGRRDVVAGLLLSGLGIVVAYYAATHYSTGSMTRIGPGMFPTIVGSLMTMLGLAVFIKACLNDGPRFSMPLVKGLYILAAVLSFALLIEPFGLVPSLIIMTVVSAAASGKLRLRQIAMLALLTAVTVPLLFVGLMQLHVPLFAWPF